LKASEVFLRRRLYKRRTDGTLISAHWLRPKYPRYWHYDMLGGLRAMAELKLIDDPRCSDALDLLERKELPAGGWAPRRALLQGFAAPGYQHAVRVDFPRGLGREREPQDE
jgi:hypothetical protein